MRKGWTAYCVTYDDNKRYLNNAHNALFHARLLSQSYKLVSVTVNDKLLVQYIKGIMIINNPS